MRKLGYHDEKLSTPRATFGAIHVCIIYGLPVPNGDVVHGGEIGSLSFWSIYACVMSI